MSDIECPLCSEQLHQMINNEQVFGCKNNHIWKIGQDNEIERQLTYIDSKIEFYIELPFNLALKTGLYWLNIENQLAVRRDMYTLRHKNPLEYPSSTKEIILNQEQLFDNDGLCMEEYAEYEYKRKMRTTISISYKFPMWTHISEEDFIQELMLDRFGRLKNYIQTQNDRLDEMKDLFRQQVNTFLDYYANVLVSNNPLHTIQHEVGSLSLFDFDKQHSGIIFRFRNVGALLDQRVEDYTSVEGIPESTYMNDDKIEAFERVIRDRNEYPILFHQEMFNLAKQLWRTKRDRMQKTIIINAMTSVESLLRQLQINDNDFSVNSTNSSVLNRYFNVFSEHRNTLMRKVLLMDVMSDIYPRLTKRKINRIIRYMNYARCIRNNIIHNGTFDYEDGQIRFNYSHQRHRCVKIDKIWKTISLLYNALNIRLMRRLHPEINWEIPIIVKNTSLAISVDRATGHTVPMIPNYDWREIHFYKIIPSEFTVPPDRFPKAIITTDGQRMMINGNMVNGRRFEVINQIQHDDGTLNFRTLSFPVDLTSEQFRDSINERNFDSIIDANGEYFYKSCEHCGDLLLITRFARYHSNQCTQCKNEFDLFNLLYNVSLLFLERDRKEMSLKYARLAYGNLEYAEMNGAFRLGELFMELDWPNFASFCWDKSYELMWKEIENEMISYDLDEGWLIR